MGDQNAIAGRRYDLARVAWSRGNYDLAGELYEETLVFVREQLKNKGAIAATLFELGEVAWAKGDLDQATKRYEEAMAVGREINGQFTIASALNGLGKVARTRGDNVTARSLQREALQILQKVGTQWGVAYALESATELALAKDNPDLAARVYGATQQFYEQFRFLLSSLERDHHEFNVRAARTALGEETFLTAWESGKSISMDEAMQLALQELS
jgi:tetratricopeptide (TPR) repeat protein